MKLTLKEDQEKVLKVGQALASKIRVRMLVELGRKPLCLSELSQVLNLSEATIERHLKVLEEAGLVRTIYVPGKRGLRRVCILNVRKLELIFS